ncbi:MAG: hypothetical protein WA071_16315 [Undibacterium umbellatum]|uniref:hypothetical protein n=1 Tax=Undibacterium umbellatum TaxID=2762300 RepID=UPI003BB546A2
MDIMTSPHSKELVESRKARDSEEYAFRTKAVTGRIEKTDDFLRANSIGYNLWAGELWQLNKGRTIDFTSYGYSNARKKEFKQAVMPGLEKLIDSEAENRGFLIYSGGGSQGSIVRLGHHNSLRWGDYAFIGPKLLAQATLYLPFIAGLNTYEQNMRVTKQKAPLVAIDEEFFRFDKDGSVRHLEFLFDPRVDIRSYKFSDTNPIRLKQLESRQLEFMPGEAEPATIAKLLGCCVYVRPPVYGNELVEFLKTVRFDATRLRIALMVQDSATRSHLAGNMLLSGHGRAEAINRETTELEPWIVSQLKKASGGTLLLLGHVEGNDYVVRSSNGAEAGRIPVRRANELALQYRVTLFNLGCKTAATLRDYDGIGVYDAFNSVHMLRSISKAIHSGPSTIADFLERLGSPEARIVIPASIMTKAESLSALKDLRDPNGLKIADGKRMRIPAVQPIVSPGEMTMGFPTSMSVFLTSARQNTRGFYPVMAELHVVMNACKVLVAAKKLKLEGSDKLTCAQYQDAPHIQVITHLYGEPERKLR